MTTKDKSYFLFTCAFFMLAGMIVSEALYKDEIMENRSLMRQYEKTIERMVLERYENGY